MITNWLIDYDFSTQGGDKVDYCIGEDDSNMCKNVVIETKLMQSQVENVLHEDVVECKVSFDMPWMF